MFAIIIILCVGIAKIQSEEESYYYDYEPQSAEARYIIAKNTFKQDSFKIHLRSIRMLSNWFWRPSTIILYNNIWPQQAVRPKSVEKIAQEKVPSPKTQLRKAHRFRFMTKGKWKLLYIDTYFLSISQKILHIAT